MCFAVYIGTTTTQTTGTFIVNQTVLYLEELVKENEIFGLRPKFNNRHIYYVGSYEGCSCGFAYDPSDPKQQDDDADKEEESEVLKSITALVSLIGNLTKIDNVEFYCCWEGDWGQPVEEHIEVDITQIKLGANYFGLKERQFIIFKKQSDNDTL